MRRNHPNYFAVLVLGNKISVLRVETVDEQARGMHVVLRDLLGKNAMIQSVNLFEFA